MTLIFNNISGLLYLFKCGLSILYPQGVITNCFFIQTETILMNSKCCKGFINKI